MFDWFHVFSFGDVMESVQWVAKTLLLVTVMTSPHTGSISASDALNIHF
jgi:hypothetical protein